MKTYIRSLFLISALLFAVFVLAACGVSSTDVDEPVQTEEPTSTLTETPAPPTETATPTATPTITPSPTPDIPGGWVTYDSELGFFFYYPQSWEVTYSGTESLQLWEFESGQGWVEFSLLDEQTAPRWGFEYVPGMSSEELGLILQMALHQDGDFAPFAPVDTRTGMVAYSSTGEYTVYDELLFVGVIGLEDGAIIMTGHSSPDAEDLEADWERLVDIYSQILWSMTIK